MLDKTVAELRKIAQDLGVPGINKMKKEDLLVAIATSPGSQEPAVSVNPPSPELVEDHGGVGDEPGDGYVGTVGGPVEEEPTDTPEPEADKEEFGTGFPHADFLQQAVDLMLPRLIDNDEKFPAFSDLEPAELLGAAKANLASVEPYLMTGQNDKALKQAGDALNYMTAYAIRVMEEA